MGKQVTLTFPVAPSDERLCRMQVKWSSLKKDIDNLCVRVYIEKTRESFFTFLSLSLLQDCVSLPLTTDLSSESFKLYIYGLERTDTPYFYRVCASGVRKLTKIDQNLQWELNLIRHKVAHMVFLKSHDGEELDLFAVTHQRVSPRQIRLTAASVSLQKDVLVAMTQDGAEFFWLTQPCAPPQGSAVAVPMELMALGVVRATVHSLRRTHCSAGVKSYAKVASSVEVDIRWPASHQAPARMPDMSLKTLKRLMEKAVNYMSKKKTQHGMCIMTHVYRNKPPSYFHAILHLHDGVMEKYRKDFNGDPACCINGVIDGLFFGTSLDRKTKQPPSFSYFGARRLHIPTQFLLNSSTNVYFADFYCHYDNHYVCLVVANKGSQTDAFCDGKLLPLDLADNPFVCQKVHPVLTGLRVVYVTTAVYVELFYTEDIDIGTLMQNNPSVVYLTTVAPRGRGKSKKYGIPKNKNCNICVL